LPHIGSAYPTIVCDYLAGHMLQRGEEVAFLTGTDEHGQKIEKAADTNNKDPQAHVDYISEEFKKLWSILEINYDYFVRTSSPQHKAFVTEFFQKVLANGDIYKGEYKGLYCVSCEDFWLEKDLEENDKGEKRICPTHKTTIEQYSQENYFFKLSKYQKTLKQYFEDNPDFISPESRKNEVLGWIKEGLRDFPISRTNLSWGIPVPGQKIKNQFENSSDARLASSEQAELTGASMMTAKNDYNEADEDLQADSHVIYVWFDALLGYISGLRDDKEKFWKDNSVVHIIGKDILRFHAVYWPAMLMSAGYPLPKKVFGHGFLTKDGMKMGKTLGNVIDPIALSERFGAEAVKYYFLREIVFGRDGDYTDESFIQCLNSDLANNLGNLLNRCLKLVSKYFAGSLAEQSIFPEFGVKFSELHKGFFTKIDELNPYFSLEDLFKLLNQANAYINDMAPWKSLKTAEVGTAEYKEAGTCLKTCLIACHRAAFYLAPVMPELSKKIMHNLGYEIDESLSRRELLTTVFSFENILSELPDTISENPEPIFQRLETVSSQ
jgi:methionyl-tRNA synthetase